MVEFIEYLSGHIGMPATWVTFLIGVFLLMQAIGELVEFKTKIAVPEIMKVRKYFARKKKEREALLKAAEIVETCDDLVHEMREVKSLFIEIKPHVSQESLQRRDNWMHSVDDDLAESKKDRAEIHVIWESLSELIEKLRIQLVMVRVEQMRNAIISFARMAADDSIPLTREEFNRIFKLYDAYEKLLAENGMENGEIDMNMDIVRSAYEKRMVSHLFVEDIKGYKI